MLLHRQGMAEGKRFPHLVEEFADDNRISYYEEDGKYILEDEGGIEWEWVEQTGKWMQAVCWPWNFGKAHGSGSFR